MIYNKVTPNINRIQHGIVTFRVYLIFNSMFYDELEWCYP